MHDECSSATPAPHASPHSEHPASLMANTAPIAVIQSTKVGETLTHLLHFMRVQEEYALALMPYEVEGARGAAPNYAHALWPL